jgi:CRP/FNR family transcriptional regulator
MITNPPAAHAAQANHAAWFVHRAGVAPEARPASLADVLHLLGASADTWASSCPVRVWRVRAGTPLYREGDPAEHLHVVRFGAFKSLRTNEDGYEHVLGYAGAGDLLGFEGLASHCHPLGVVALEDASVLVLPVHDLDHWRWRSPTLDRALQRIVSRQLVRASDTAAMMAAVAAEVRLARFLVWMSARMAARGESPTRFVLRMSRRDIASLLAVAHETVSRCFALLADCGYVSVRNRDVEIIDMAGLVACTRSTRRDTEEGPKRAATANGRRARRSVEAGAAAQAAPAKSARTVEAAPAPAGRLAHEFGAFCSV